MTCGRPSSELDNVRTVSLQQHKDISLSRDQSMPPQPKRPLESASQELASQDNCVNTPENKNEERIAALEEQLIASNKQISSLKTENLTLKEDVRALQRFTSSFSRCQLCNKAFKRSDGLRKHLREGDTNHRRFFTEHYKTECEECGRKFKDCGAYNRHMRSKRHASLSHMCESRTTSR